MNRPHVDIGPRPVNIGSGLRSGRYLAQVRDADPGEVLYATAAQAPADLDDWFSARPGEYFTFSASAARPCWARTRDLKTIAGDADAHATLAIADYRA